MLKPLPTALAVFLSSVACVPIVGAAGPEKAYVRAQALVEPRSDGGAIRFTRPEIVAPPSQQPTAPHPLDGRMSVGAEPDGRAPAGSAAQPSSENGEPARPKAVAPPAPQPEAPARAQPRNRSDTDDASFKVARVASGDVLNVRSGPSPDHDIVGSLAADARGLRVTGLCRSRWCPIEHRSLTGWVNRAFLASERDQPSQLPTTTLPLPRDRTAARDDPSAPRSCLSPQARTLLGRIEAQFGPVRLVSTCRAGARIVGTGRVSKHASGDAIDFDAGSRRQAIVDWLVANHLAGGTMTYPAMDHIHVDIGPHFVSLASGRRIASPSRRFGEPMGLGGRN